MANKSISMLQIRRILQLLSSGSSKLGISKQMQVHRKTIDNYISKLKTSGKTAEELLRLDDNSLRDIFFKAASPVVDDNRYGTLKGILPGIVPEIKKPGVTRKLLWEEYKEANPDGYGYTQFCEHFSKYQTTNKAVMYFLHQPGDYLQVDLAGKHLSYIDKITGEVIRCPVLVCTLPFSKYTYAEALASGCQQHIFAALNRCLEYFGGVPKNVLSDNMKQYVKKNMRYEFTFQELACQWSVHYNTNLDATRPSKPKDKPTVENHVYITYLRIYSRLRKQQVCSLEELNHNIRISLAEHNKTPFQKLPNSRAVCFAEQEKGLLKPLPAEPFLVKHKTSSKVHMNYHVVLGEDKHQYSVPFQYIGQQTQIVYDQNNVEIFIGMERIAAHKRSYRRNGYTTLSEHMPQSHLRYIETRGWDEDYFLGMASKIGPNAKEVFKYVLASRDFIEQSYKACIGLKRLADTYKTERFEAACQRALRGTKINYGVIKNILEKSLDKQEIQQPTLFRVPDHQNIRGASTYN